MLDVYKKHTLKGIMVGKKSNTRRKYRKDVNVAKAEKARRNWRKGGNVVRAVNGCWGEKAWAATIHPVDDNVDDDCKRRASMTRDHLLRSIVSESHAIDEKSLTPRYRFDSPVIVPKNIRPSSTEHHHEVVEMNIIKKTPRMTTGGRVPRKQQSNLVEKPHHGSSHIIVSPGEHDVLFGRGVGIYNRPGNVRFRKIVEEQEGAYRALETSPEKTKCSEAVMDQVRSHGGRFLIRYEESLDERFVRASMTQDYSLESTAPEPRINEQTLAPGYKLNDESSSVTAANCFVKQSSSPVISPNNAVKMPKEQNKSGDDINYVIVSKGKDDVLTGRGNSSNLHPGNERFRGLIQKRKETYHNLKTRPQKKRFSEGIVDEVQLYGGRFLKRLPGDETWILQDRNKAREKVSQALRDASKYKSTA